MVICVSQMLGAQGLRQANELRKSSLFQPPTISVLKFDRAVFACVTEEQKSAAGAKRFRKGGGRLKWLYGFLWVSAGSRHSQSRTVC